MELGRGKMENNNQIQIIENKIFTIRGQQVMLDRDLAELYQVETKVLNQAVKRNLDIFPKDFMFQLTAEEWEFLRSQIVTLKSKRGQHRKYLPYVFTEIGCNSVSGVLNSAVAKSRSIFIHRAFVAMKNQIFSNPNYELLREQILRLQSDTKLFNAKAETIHAEMLAHKKDHKIELNVQNMEINDLNEKMTELLTEFNKFRDSSIIIKKDDGIGKG
jgi:hypothetical protein